jgi:hypothetical protein
MPNPLVAQGTLNRLVASVTWQNFSSLNVTPSFLNREAIRLALEGQSVVYLPTIAGAVTSPEPYMMISCTIHLLKTQQIAGLYKAQMESNALLGNGVVRPDVAQGQGGLPPYDIVNCSIAGVRELDFSGNDAGWAVTCRGYYLVNNSLWG